MDATKEQVEVQSQAEKPPAQVIRPAGIETQEGVGKSPTEGIFHRVDQPSKEEMERRAHISILTDVANRLVLAGRRGHAPCKIKPHELQHVFVVIRDVLYAEAARGNRR